MPAARSSTFCCSGGSPSRPPSPMSPARSSIHAPSSSYRAHGHSPSRLCLSDIALRVSSNADCVGPISIHLTANLGLSKSEIIKIVKIFGLPSNRLQMQHHFHADQWLPYPKDLVFAFFANPENLPRLMPKWQKARIEEAVFAPPPPRPTDTVRYPGMAAGSGTRLTISGRPFPLSPLRLPWEALIEDFRWNEGFCDVQVRGPFAYWRHCHSVVAKPLESGQAGTVVNDDVTYEPPLGKAGELANTLAIRRGMQMMFRYRQSRTVELLAMMTGRQ